MPATAAGSLAPASTSIAIGLTLPANPKGLSSLAAAASLSHDETGDSSDIIGGLTDAPDAAGGCCCCDQSRHANITEIRVLVMASK
jgi:hypothetical protein